MGKNTNVVKFLDAYDGRTFYLEGVGTRLGFIGKLFGGLAGLGGRFRIKDAMEKLEYNFADGDPTIDIIGFSRGASLALHFANEIQEEMNGAEVRFLGLWDVVASFGIPGNGINIGWTLTLPKNVRKCCHAMALDERRGNFPLTRIRTDDGDIADNERLQEVWFRGVHSDVGGSLSIGLSSIALTWMLKCARKDGVPIDEAIIKRYEALCDPEAPVSKNFDPKLDPLRIINAGDAVHESVKARRNTGGIEHNDPLPGMAIA